MGLSKNNQIKFRIDDHTKIALDRLLKNKKITLQSIMENLLIEYIVKKDSIMLITTDKAGNEKIQKSTVEPFIDMPIIVLVNEKKVKSNDFIKVKLKYIMGNGIESIDIDYI